VRRRDPGEPQSATGQPGERGPEQAQLADALVRGQYLGQRPGGPAPPGSPASSSGNPLETTLQT